MNHLSLNQMLKAFTPWICFGACFALVLGCDGKDGSKREKTDSKTSKSDTASGFTPKDNDAAVPAESVSGAYLTVECVITNKNDPSAKDTNAACKIMDNRRGKYTGQIEGAQLKMERVSSTSAVPGSATFLPANSEYSFMAIFAGVSPGDALGVELKAKFDGVFAVLYDLLDEYSTKNTVPKDYYVSSTASPENSQCTKELPCKSINRAMRLLPDTIGPLITIHVEEGNYPETLAIAGKEFDPSFRVTQSTSLKIIGEKAPNSTTSDIPRFKLQGPPKETFMGAVPPPMLNISFIESPGLLIENLDVESCYNFAIHVLKAEAAFKSTQVSGCHYPFIGDNKEIIVDNKEKKEDQEPKNMRFEALSLKEANVELKGELFKIVDFDTSLMTASLGIFLSKDSTLNSNSDLIIEPKLHYGIYLAGESSMTINPNLEIGPERLLNVKILQSSEIAVYVGNSSKLMDRSTRPTRQKFRSIFDFGTVGVGFFVTGSSTVSLITSDVLIGTCSSICLNATDKGTISFGQGRVLPAKLEDRGPNDIQQAVLLNYLPSVSPSSGRILNAESESSITLRSTIEYLTICNSSHQSAFRAGEKSTIRIAAQRHVLSKIEEKCSSPLAGKVDFGLVGDKFLAVDFINASKSESILKECSDGELILDCRNRAIGP
ncbi:MAG: hypothetical protein NT027_07950 [Proteobacteria bacterium]|nr:hypothetical protein [Pseudomonadota bacterium]